MWPGPQTAAGFELSSVRDTANIRHIPDAPEVQDIICMVEVVTIQRLCKNECGRSHCRITNYGVVEGQLKIAAPL